ncbi:MAG: hypothetical protein [Bacteriophage sp.]|nr:MAG: hypothetical protein [Bacteriophage sp.]
MMNRNYDKGEVKRAMSGSWPNALMQLCGVDSRAFNGKHQACPNCGGVDRFRYDDGKGSAIKEPGAGWAFCSACGSGDGFTWFAKLYGEPFNVCVNILGDWINAVPVEARQAAQVAVTRLPEYNYSKSADHERCVALMAQCEALDSVAFISHGIDASFQGKGSFTYHPINMVEETDVSKSMCNVARLDSELSDVSFLAGGQTFGAVHVIGAREGNIYLTISLSDGWHAHHCTGREVWVCFTAANLDHVVRRYRGDRHLRLACLTTEFDALVYAEENALQVMTPNAGRWSMGLEKVIKSAGEILDKKIPAD